MSSTICRRRAGGSAAQRSFGSMLIAFETFDRGYKIVERLYTKLRPIRIQLIRFSRRYWYQ
jgi:hypothetical protein